MYEISNDLEFESLETRLQEIFTHSHTAKTDIV
jgi:hypothetical protein